MPPNADSGGRYRDDDWRAATEECVRRVWDSNMLRFIKNGIEWPRYIRCDGAECPIDWDHWHFVNEDGTAAGTDWMAVDKRLPHNEQLRGRVTCHPHHAKAHADITDRLTTWTWIPGDRKLHALRQTAWAVNDHLRCCHGARRLINPAGRLRQMIDLHAQLHQAAR